jgi:hypothetical protein
MPSKIFFVYIKGKKQTIVLIVIFGEALCKDRKYTWGRAIE